VNALRRIHVALVPDGLVVDTQPVSARPTVEAGGRQLGTLDMREWRVTIDAVDALVAETIGAGLFAMEVERCFTVAERLAGDERPEGPGAADRGGDPTDQRASGGAAAPAAGAAAGRVSWRVGAVDLARVVRPLHDPRHRDRGELNGGVR
jgi:hypothetical protein